MTAVEHDRLDQVSALGGHLGGSGAGEKRPGCVRPADDASIDVASTAGGHAFVHGAGRGGRHRVGVDVYAGEAEVRNRLGQAHGGVGGRTEATISTSATSASSVFASRSPATRCRPRPCSAALRPSPTHRTSAPPGAEPRGDHCAHLARSRDADRRHAHMDRAEQLTPAPGESYPLTTPERPHRPRPQPPDRSRPNVEARAVRSATRLDKPA